VLRHGDLELDPARRTLTRAGQPIELARKEFAVLETLMASDRATVSAEELLERVWDEHTDPFTNVVRMTIMTLRRKLGDPPVVETVIGVGYRLS
jgi:DNA-binding response OmpR family regulator